MNKLRVTILIFNFLIIFSLDAFDFSLELENTYYNWQEYGEGNRKLLEEKGSVNGISNNIYFSKKNNENYKYRFSIGVYKGSQNYDGQDQRDNKFYSDTDIKGVKSNFSCLKEIYNKEKKELKLEAVAGIGFDLWKRSIKSGNSYEKGIPDSASYINGYNEYYRQLYMTLGILSRYKKFEVEVGTSYPLYFDEKVELSKIGYLNDLKVDLGKEFSPYIKSSFMLKKNLKIKLNIETKLIEPSTQDNAYYYGDYGKEESSTFLQPKSRQIKGTLSFEYYI